MSRPDPLTALLRRKASEIESRRIEEARRRRAEEERRRRLHQKHVSEAREELGKYLKLIKEARQYLDEYWIIAEYSILRELYDQIESDPQHVVEEARGYRRLLERQLKEAKEKVRLERMKRWHSEKQLEALIKLYSYKHNLGELLDSVSWDFYELRLKSISNPNLEKLVCEELGVKSLDEAEKLVKEAIIDMFRKRLKKDLSGNPYA